MAVMFASLVLLALGKIWAWTIAVPALVFLMGFFLVQLHAKASFIRFGSDGVTICYLYQEKFIKWTKIEAIRVERKRKLTNHRHAFQAPLIRVVLFFRNLLHVRGIPTVVLSLSDTGSNEKTEFILPTTYQMQPEKLAELLTEWKQQEQAATS